MHRTRLAGPQTENFERVIVEESQRNPGGPDHG
jgi:hypothetical protein